MLRAWGQFECSDYTSMNPITVAVEPHKNQVSDRGGDRMGYLFSYVTTEVKHCPHQEPHAFDPFNSALKDFMHEQILALLAPAVTGQWAITFASFSDIVMNHTGLCHTSHPSRFCDTF